MDVFHPSIIDAVDQCEAPERVRDAYRRAREESFRMLFAEQMESTLSSADEEM